MVRTQRGRRVQSTKWSSGLVALGLLGGAVSWAGCYGSGGEGTADGKCQSTREYFTTEVYGKALGSCTSCHSQGGEAIEKGAKFVIYRDTYPDFVSANIAAMTDYAKIRVDDKPVILRKPLGERAHGGGAVLKENSEEFKILSKFIGELSDGTERSCNDNGALQVSLMTNREVARKAALLLAGRMPTEVELTQAASGDAPLAVAVLNMTRDEKFYDFLRETWNDVLLTQRGIDPNTAEIYNNAPELYDDTYPGYTTENRQWLGTSLTEEPMRFIDYVVRNDLPFSDVVAGNYVVANPFVARAYGLPHTKELTAANYLEWERIDYSPAQNQSDRDGKNPRTVAVPAAGVLSTPAFLARWETTATNRGRKRARVVMKTFLATDIFKFAQRPVDSTALTSVQNPTFNSAMCTVCHTAMDPIAGAFRGYSERNDMALFDPADKWHDDMRPPGINGVSMPPENYGNALMWTGAQIPRDPRFAISISQIMYQGLIGLAPLGFPQDKAAADYKDKVLAYSAQNDWFVTVARNFAESKFDLRKLVADIVLSPYFRAKSSDIQNDALHDDLGPGRLLSPEMLGRKYFATTGLYYFGNDSISQNYLRARDDFRRNDLIEDRDWRLVYGGIDSGDVTKRTETISPIMLATAQYTGGIVACRSTSYDFTKPAADRRLFRDVELNTTPFTIRATADSQLVPVPGAEEAIRKNMASLYFRLLGETVGPDSEEVNQTYALFVDVWKDLEDTDLKGGGKNKGMWNDRCRAAVDFDQPAKFEPNKDGNTVPVYQKLRERPDGAAYEAGMVLDRDDNYTVRSWQAVMTYLLTDYRFTHE